MRSCAEPCGGTAVGRGLLSPCWLLLVPGCLRWSVGAPPPRPAQNSTGSSRIQVSRVLFPKWPHRFQFMTHILSTVANAGRFARNAVEG